MIEHLPALQVVIPLICAPLCMLVRYRDWSWIVALFGSWASLVISWLLLQQVMDAGVISYHMGNWAPPLGIEYRIDFVNACPVDRIRHWRCCYAIRSRKRSR